MEFQDSSKLGRYDNWGAQNSFDGVGRYHCTPTYDPADIICPGSDAEETLEETRKKRQRYEDMAKRYEKGERPMIQSASLRGPLSEESGWINPWRYRPRKPREENNWWQPGSEDMLFTRENVMRRAAAHGLGYMSPAEALAWCKASAQAEVDLRMRDQSQGGILMSVEDDIQSNNANESSHDSTDHDEDEHLEDYQNQRSPFEPNQEAQTSMVNNYSTPSIGQPKNNPGKGVKRVVDAEWLKGSYISKRARWDGPVMPSPTPAAGVLGHRKERRRHLPLKHGTAREIHVQQPALSLSGFKSIRKEVTMSKPVSRHGRGLSGSGSARGNSTETPAFITEGPRTPRTTISKFYRQVDDVDELQDEIQEFSSVMSSQGSRKPSRSSSRNFEERCMSDLEPDELVAIIPYGRRDAQTPVDYNTHSPRKCSNSNKLPTLPRNVAANDEDEYARDVSFITEIAPSSGDLEKFMFRKKRRTFVPTRSELALNVITPDEDSQRTSSLDMPIETEQDARSGNSSHSSIEGIAEQEGSIEDYSDDLEAAPKLHPNTQKVIASIAGAFTPINDEGHESDGDSLVPLPQKLPHYLPIPQQRSSFLIRSSQITQPKDQPILQKLSEDLELAFELPVQVTRSHNINDIITQSFNTTRTCSRKTPAKGRKSSSKKRTPKSLLQKELPVNVGPLREELFSQGSSLEEHYYFGTISKANMPEDFDDIDHTESDMECEANDARVLVEINYGDEMRQIQKVLSQQCQSTSSEDSTPRPEKEQHDQEGNVNVQEPEEENIKVAPVETNGVEKENNDMNVIVKDVEVKDTRPEVLKLRLADQPSPKGLIASLVSPAQRSQSSPKQVKEPDLEVTEQDPDHVSKTPSSHDNNGVDSTGAAASSPHNNDVQSPFAQEVFIMDVPRLDTSTEMGVAPASPAAESETSWQGCGPQSPWATEAIEPLPKFTVNIEANRDVSIHLLPLFPKKAPIEEGEIIRPSSIALVQEIPEEGFERPQTPENGGIKAFRDLISPLLVPEHKKNSEDKRPTGTQLLVDAATKNPWSSSLRKPGSKRPKKRVSFGHFPMEKSDPESQELEELRRSRRSLPLSRVEKDSEDWRRTRYSPPPSSEDDLFDGGMYRAGFVGATPKATTFSNHFNAMRKFTRLLSEGGSFPSKSSPNLGGQAEAFIAADREASTERKRRTLLQESPIKHLQPRSTATDNIIWQDCQEDFPRADERSSRSPSGKAQTFASGMANFDMDAALGEMSEFLEDWSVDAELKKAKDDADRERRDNGLRRRRLFGLV